MTNPSSILILLAAFCAQFCFAQSSSDIIATQAGGSTTVYFEPDSSIYDPANIYNWDFGFNSDSAFNDPFPIYTYGATGIHIVTLEMVPPVGNPSYFTDSVDVLCPLPQPAFAAYINDSTVFFDNLTTYDSASSGPVTYNWSFGDGTFSSAVSPTYTYGSSGTYVAMLEVTTDCGTAQVTQDITVGVGYSSDFPKDGKYCDPGGRFTPLIWRDPMHQFPKDIDTNHIDDAISVGGGFHNLLVYYSIPKGQTIPSIERAIRDASQATTLYHYDFITVFHLKGVPGTNISPLAALPYVHFLEADLPFQPNSNWSLGSPLTIEQVVEMLGIHSTFTNCTIPTLTSSPQSRKFLGTATNLCIIGNGVGKHPAVHTAFYNSPDAKLQVKMPDFTENSAFAGNPDPSGRGTAMASILYKDISPSPAGVATNSTPAVANIVDAQGMARPSQLLKAIEWAIAEEEVQVIYCDFETVVSDGSDAISVALDVASMLRKLCIAGAGSGGVSGIKAPGASQRTLTVGMAATEFCYSGYAVHSASGRGSWGGWHNAKPDVSAPGGIWGATKGENLRYKTMVAGSEVSALLVAGLASMFCEKNPRLTIGSWKHLVRICAADRLGNGWDVGEGFGTPDADAMCDSLFDPGRRFDLGFTEHQNLYWPGGNTPIPTGVFNSKNISSNIFEGPIVAGNPYDIYVIVENFSDKDYPGNNRDAILEVSLHDFGNSYLHGNAFASITVPPIPRNSSVKCTLQVTSPIDITAACIGAQIIFPYDINSQNNSAKKNCHYIRVPSNVTQVKGDYLFAMPPCIIKGMAKARETDLTGTGVSAINSFVDGSYHPDSLPRWENVCFNTANAPCPSTISYDVVFINDFQSPSDSLWGGVNFTLFLDTVPEAGSEPESLLRHLTLSPNPASDLFHIAMTFNRGGRGHAYVADLHGRILGKQEFLAAAGQRKRLKFELEGMAAGVYVVGVEMGAGRWVRRVVKM